MADRVQVTTVANATVAIPLDERLIDEMQIRELGDALRQTLEDDACQNLLVSFENVKFMSSSTLTQLITLNRESKSKGKALKLASICEEIMEVFRITSLDSVFDIADSVEEGVESFGD